MEDRQVSRAMILGRLAGKTPKAAFLHVLQADFRFSPIVSRQLLATAKEGLVDALPAEALEQGGC
ncbi:MAG: hypothetical protein RBU35_24260 [Anaerolineae bacterium]|nr:hypothetical protein [Anaerolineae bacterium]